MRGLAGLVVLGNAWESVDVFHALNVALQPDSLGFEKGREGGRNTLAYLAWLRCRELIDAGKGSMLPDAPEGRCPQGDAPPARFRAGRQAARAGVRDLRAEADAWQVARTAFMTGRLNEGRHPDTDPHFWDGYTERPAPGLPVNSVPETIPCGEDVGGARPVRDIGVPSLLVVLLVARSVSDPSAKGQAADGWSADAVG